MNDLFELYRSGVNISVRCCRCPYRAVLGRAVHLSLVTAMAEKHIADRHREMGTENLAGAVLDEMVMAPSGPAAPAKHWAPALDLTDEPR